MVRDVEYSERELARLKSLVEEAEKVYSEARLKAQETLQQAQKEIAEKRRNSQMEEQRSNEQLSNERKELDRRVDIDALRVLLDRNKNANK